MSEQLKNKLHDYEIPPPPGVWENIYYELKENNELLFLSQKMYNYEVDPPEASWQIISQDLVQNLTFEFNQPPVKRINKRMYVIIAAATVVGVILLGSLYIVNSINFKSRISARQDSNPEKVENKPAEPLSIATPPNKSEPRLAPHMSATISGSIIHKAKNKNVRESNKILHNTLINNVRSLGTELGIIIQPKPIRNEKGYIIQNLNQMKVGANDYISITGPNGQQTKISSKFMNVLLYLNGDNNIEQFEGYFSKSFMESLIWKSRFQEWRDKILQTSLIPSSYNFMDILEFKDLIIKDKEKQSFK